MKCAAIAPGIVTSRWHYWLIPCAGRHASAGKKTGSDEQAVELSVPELRRLLHLLDESEEQRAEGSVVVPLSTPAPGGSQTCPYRLASRPTSGGGSLNRVCPAASGVEATQR